MNAARAKRTKGLTPDQLLRKAAKLDEVKKLRSLVKAGVDVNAQDKEAWTALHFASIRGSLEGIYLLLEAGSEIDARTTSGTTPLHLACASGYTNTALFLLKKGADVEARDEDGWTPLHWACWQGRVDTTEALMKAGADMGAKSNSDQTPLDIAKLRNISNTLVRERMLDLFRQYAPELVLETYCQGPRT